MSQENSVTDNDDNLSDEVTVTEEVMVGAEADDSESMQREFGNDFEDDDGAEDAEGAEELTPNDIFGLDPLDVLTLEELAEYLKVSPAAARRAAKEQNLPSRNIGGELRFLRDAVANWLRGQEAPAQQQQKAREDYSKSPATPSEEPNSQFSYRQQRPSQGEQSTGYQSRQRFPESGQQSGGQQGQYGDRRPQYGRSNQYGGGNQYGSGNQQGGGGNQQGGQYRGSYGGNQYGGGQQSSQGDEAGGGGYARPPRRPFRSESAGQGGYQSGEQGASAGSGSGGYASGGYSAGGGGGGYRGGGGYSGEPRFGGGAKRKNKRQVFSNERGKRMDRRKEEGQPEGQE